MQARKELDQYLDNSLVNKLFSSPLPESCRSSPCILGIDEAGRGPVLGPMVYAVAFYPRNREAVLAKMKFADSKELTEATREKLFEAIQQDGDGFADLGYTIKIISPNMISNSMLRRKKYNLNSLSHDTAIDLIRSVEALGIKIDQVYIDTVGPALKYKEKLQTFFPKYNFTVAEKADSKFPIVSAASVCAKVSRDRIVKNWKYAECDSLHLGAFNLGSGYPADPETKRFLVDSLDPVFGFPTLARFSWSTITKILEKDASKCDWNEPDDDEVVAPKVLMKQQNMMKNFFMVQSRKNSAQVADKLPIKSSSTGPTSATTRQNRTTADIYFEDRNLTRVMVWS